jgi:hypothetical protein
MRNATNCAPAGNGARHVGGQRRGCRHLRRRQDPQIRQVQRQVERDDNDHPQDVGLGKVPRGIADFRRDVRTALPAAVSEENRHQRGEQQVHRRAGEYRAGRRIEVAGRRRAAAEREGDERDHAEHLRGHQQVVRPFSGAHAERVDGREPDERERSADTDAGGAERDEGAIDIGREQDRHRRQRPAVDDEQQRDAVEKPDDGRIGALKIDVLAADVRKTRRQLRPDECPDEGNDAAQRPHQQDEHRVAHDPRDIGRVREDADADDAAGDHDGRIEQTEFPSKACHVTINRGAR